MHPRRNFGLDLLRATAIAMVFLAHGVTALGVLGVGVDLFFVLSGFLIGRIYLRAQADAHLPRGTFTLWRFWRARWFRTLPPYLVALALYAMADTHFHNNAVHPRYLLFLQNYLGMDGFGPSWSLAVEEHFYLLLPLVGALLLRRPGRRALAWTLPMLALVPTVLRAGLAVAGALPTDWYWRSHLHCEGLVLGVWLASLQVDRPALWQRARRWAWLVAPLPVALLAYQATHPAQPLPFRVVAFLLYAVGYAAWLRLGYDLAWQPSAAVPLLVHRAVSGLALASYSLYLVHVLVFTDVRVLVGAWPRGPVKSGTILLAALAAGVVFYFAVERPTILLRDRLFSRARQTTEREAVPAVGSSASS